MLRITRELPYLVHICMSLYIFIARSRVFALKFLKDATGILGECHFYIYVQIVVLQLGVSKKGDHLKQLHFKLARICSINLTALNTSNEKHKVLCTWENNNNVL